MSSQEISIIVSTYQRPYHLKRSLISMAMQKGVSKKFEVIVTDDGSRDETADVVRSFARDVDFPVKFTTHHHNGFQLSRCRNEGVAASSAPYLLFTDGDCVLPPDHIRWHLDYRRKGYGAAGDCYRLDEATSEKVDEHSISSNEYLDWIPKKEKRRIAAKARHARVYQFFRVPMRPRLTGCNIAVWREDFDKVNGFDANYVRWGLEDRDFQLRLSHLGIRFRSIVGRTAVCHLWHTVHSTFVRNCEGTPNYDYFHRKDMLTYCLNGYSAALSGDFSIHDCHESDEPVIHEFPATRSNDEIKKAI